MRVFSKVMPGEVKVFPATGLDDALAWAAGDAVTEA